MKLTPAQKAAVKRMAQQAPAIAKQNDKTRETKRDSIPAEQVPKGSFFFGTRKK